MRFGKQLWFAGAAAGTIVTAISGAAFAQDINETVNGPSSGVVAAGVGPQNVTVTITKKGDVDNPAGPAVVATAQQGAVTVTDNGQVAGSAGGILGQTSGPSVAVTVTQGVSGGTGNAIEALDNTGGAASVTVGSGHNAKHPLAIATTGKIGAGAVSVTGDAAIQVGDNVAISAGAPGLAGPVDVLALGVLTPSDTNGPSAVATVGENATLTLAGNNGAAVSAQIGLSGQEGPNGAAGASVTVGDGVDINVSGFSNAGVIGFVRDLTPFGVYAGAGDVSVTVGTGVINVNETGAVGNPTGAMTNLGVGAFSAGGNVSVVNAADITVNGGQDASVGIRAATSGAGSASVTDSGSITSTNGDAIDVLAGTGAATVTVTDGDLTAGGTGVNAASFGGPIDVSTAKSVGITAAFGGIVAGGLGPVTVTSGGPIVASLGDGIDANGLAVSVQVEGDIVAGGTGVSAIGEPVDVAIGKSVSIAAGGTGVSASGAGPSDISLGKSVVIAAGGPGVVDVSQFGTATLEASDDVGVTAGASGRISVADLAANGVLTSSGVGASVDVGRNASLTVAGNASAAISSRIGQGGVQGPLNGTASAEASVGNGVSINVSGFDDAGVFVTATDITPSPRFFGLGNASVTVGTGLVNVNEIGATGPAPGFKTNVGEGAFSGAGNVSVTNGADISVTGQVDATQGIETLTFGNGTSSITTSGDITVDNGNGVWARTQNGANTIDVAAGMITASNAGILASAIGSGVVSVDVGAQANVSGAAGVQATSLGAGGVTIDNAGQLFGDVLGGVVVSSSLAGVAITNEFSGRIEGVGGGGAPAIFVSGGDFLVSIDNAGFIGARNGDPTADILSDSAAGALTFTNQPGGLLDGVFSTVGPATLNNSGVWLTSGPSQLGAASASVVNNAGLIQVGEDPAGAPVAASILGLAAFNNGSASATGVVSMINGHVGDSLTVSGLFTGAPGHSLLGLDAQLGGPGSTADQLILTGGSAGQTLIWVHDVLHGAGALNPAGIVLVQGSSGAATFALDPRQPGYDPATKGIDKGLFTYPLVFSGGAEMLVGEPGLSAHQMATWGAAAEDIWSSTSPGDQSEAHLASSLANGDDEAATGGLHVWAQALNGGPSRLNGGLTMLGRANFAGDPMADATAPLAGVAAQTASTSAFGMTYGFDTGYAQNVSALITGVDLGRHVGDRDAWSWGVSTGYLESQQSFTAGSSTARYQGALAAVHGAYVTASGFHVAGDVKMTALQLSYATAWGGGGASTPNAAIDTFGGEADAGWTRPLGGGWTLDPVASFSMQTSKLGSLSVAGAAVSFGDASSVRLGVGAKLSGGGRIFGLAWKSQSSLQLWDELRGANTLQLVEAGAGQLLPDPIGGTFTDVAQSFSLAAPDGHASAFVSGAYRWRSDYQAAQLSMGVRLAW